jgi:hypothetical protein
MSTAVHTPRLPSSAEIEKAMRERLPGLVIYNPSTEWIQLEVFGLTHLWACPDLNGAVEPHPVTGAPTKCDGETEIKGRFLTQKDSSGKVIEGQDAPAMVKHLIGPDKYGQMGMVWIPPGITVEEKDKYKDLSRRVFSDYQSKQDEALVSKRAEFKANWTKSGLHKGEPCPPPTAAESAALDRLQARKRSRAWKFECDVPECPGYAVNEWERFEAHMRTAHNISPKRSQFEGDVSGLSDKVLPASDGPEFVPPRSGIEAAAAKLAEEIPESKDEPEEEGEEDRPRARRSRR